jgi:hypothetical protein
MVKEVKNSGNQSDFSAIIPLIIFQCRCQSVKKRTRDIKLDLLPQSKSFIFPDQLSSFSLHSIHSSFSPHSP